MNGNATLADQLRQAITARRLSTYRLARMTGLSSSVVARLVNGQDVSLGSMEKLCDAAGVSVVLRPDDHC